MRGAWAGEIGQTQFMPSSYIKFAVDFDGNGRRDLLRSAPDVLASTANFLASYGWQRAQGLGARQRELRRDPASGTRARSMRRPSAILRPSLRARPE